LTSFLFATALTGWLYYQTKNRIGDLSENKKTSQDFEVCDEDRIGQNYGLTAIYEGGKKAIKQGVLNELEDLSFEKPGLITFRFIVNCKGEIGRFRAKSTDIDLQEMEVTTADIKKIEQALLQLINWTPAKNDFDSYDSYYVLNFKIRNDKIVDIF
jgi:hypothetical protein